MIRTAWTFALKDLRLFFRDRTGLLLSLLLPICLATIFGFAMGGLGGDDGMGKVKILVEDLDQSDASRALVAELEKSRGLRVERRQDVRKSVAGGKVAAALLIPSGYGVDLAAGHTPQIKLYRDPGKTVEQQVIAGNLLPAFVKANGGQLGRAMMHRGMKLFGVPAYAEEAAQRIADQTWDSMQALALSDSNGGGGTAPAGGDFDFSSSVSKLLGIEIEDVAGGKDATQKVAQQAHAVSGIAVMMLLFGLAGCGATILEEQASGTLQRIQLCPTSSTSILLGKFLYTVIAGCLQLVILFPYGALLFDLPLMRAPVALIVLSLAVVCAASSMGMLLAVVCKTRKQLEGLSTLVILAMSALGGSWFPLFITPGWYQKLGHFTLNAWAMDGYQGIFWYGKGLTGILLEVGVLFAIALVVGALAWRGFVRRFGVAS